MANFLVERDARTDVVRCVISGFLADADAEALAAQLGQQVQLSRNRGRPLRMLFDNEHGSVFSASAAQALVQLRGSYRPQDRTAVVVSDNIHKLQTRRNASEGTEMFVSAVEAMAWLTAPEA
jgi:hypothetical protein